MASRYNQATGALNSMARNVLDVVMESLKTDAEGLSLMEAHNLVNAAVKVSRAAESLLNQIERNDVG